MNWKMNYKIIYYSTDSFCKLQEVWKYLETGSEMTYFQSYEWYQILVDKNSKIRNRKHEIVFVQVNNDKDEPLFIAPFWIVYKTFKLINKKGCYFFGRQGWNDYCNLIYRTFDKNALSFLLKEVSIKYGLSDFYFDYLKEDTCIYKWIVDRCCLYKDRKEICVSLDLPQTIHEYNSLLSKHSKQNIRTGKNRFNKNGGFVNVFDDRNVDLETFINYREKRVAEKNKFEFTTKKIKKLIYNFLVYHFPWYVPYLDDKRSLFCSIYTKADHRQLCASVNYAIDESHKTIYIMAISTGAEYAWYSPGVILLYDFICYLIEKKNVKVLDFTRGNEQYKYALGGKNHYNHSVKFRIK